MFPNATTSLKYLSIFHLFTLPPQNSNKRQKILGNRVDTGH